MSREPTLIQVRAMLRVSANGRQVNLQ